MPEEMRFLLRGALYSLGVGVVYWFLSYEPAGTALLLGLGLAAGAVFSVMWLDLRRRGRRLSGPPWRWIALAPADEESHLTDESGRVPRPTLAPLSVGGGIALAALGLVFGVAMVAAAVVPLIVGLRAWLNDAMAEYRATAGR